MPSFSQASLERLNTCHPDLQRLFMEVVKTTDCTVIEGHRDKDAQHEAFVSGHSKLDWPKGNHNKKPSQAVDVAPYPVDWQYLPGFYYFAGVVIATAAHMGIKIRWGGDWQRTGNLKANRFADLVHFEVI